MWSSLVMLGSRTMMLALELLNSHSTVGGPKWTKMDLFRRFWSIWVP